MKSSSNIVGPKTLDGVGQCWMSILNTVKSDATSPNIVFKRAQKCCIQQLDRHVGLI